MDPENKKNSTRAAIRERQRTVYLQEDLVKPFDDYMVKARDLGRTESQIINKALRLLLINKK